MMTMWRGVDQLVIDERPVHEETYFWEQFWSGQQTHLEMLDAIIARAYWEAEHPAHAQPEQTAEAVQP